jgi:hypothetical protein
MRLKRQVFPALQTYGFGIRAGRHPVVFGDCLRSGDA